ncbi:PREDICTED: peptide chain release factor 1-like, mitochondrial [Hipposideros armiger]|uniref:Peptide chain release factor 1-like, mitochondrial n=1 Tax=Hipposideros armiger TaxID=186990 RepID=A0A8B7QP78_HIPAR|nr:PREDICTED: peptide chain release factor 1-like, mitochondrial [Hipposideros armiger]
MRSRLLLSVARCLWTRRASGPARRHISCGSPPLEELFARGGPLRTYLERQAGSESHLQVRGSELVAVAKLLSDKEQELQETEHLLHDENDLILEVTAGVGGQEAMLFTAEMFDMYQQYAAFKGWHFETLEYFPSEIGQ